MPYMPLDAKIYVAGHQGLVGSAITRELKSLGYHHVIGYSSKEADLTDQAVVRKLFAEEKPEFLFIAAAKVGGIHANNIYPADFIYKNLMIQSNLIEVARQHNVKRLIFLGSTCIYPRDCPQPMREEYLLSGPLEPTNRPYAVAKIAGIEMCWSYNRQFGTRYIALMPTNLYGPGDNYDLENSHVIPALMRKMHNAKMDRASEVVLWGTGKARREFLYGPDLAQAAIFLCNLPDSQYDALVNPKLPHAPLVNVGCGEDLTIAELAIVIAQTVGYSGRFVWDSSKPDGTPRKVTDVSRINALGWTASTPLTEGLRRTYAEVDLGRKS